MTSEVFDEGLLTRICCYVRYLLRKSHRSMMRCAVGECRSIEGVRRSDVCL